MRINNRVCIVVVLLMAGLVSANTVWTPIDPNAVANGYSKWNWTNGTATNWNNGIPTMGAGANDGKAVFTNGLAVECRVDSMVGCNYFVMGDGGTPSSVVRIVNGGTLYTQGSDWSAIGYSVPAIMIVEPGGKLQICGRLGVGWFDATTGTSQLLVNGGNVVIGADSNGNLQLGTDGASNPLHKGYIQVANGGLIEVNGGLNFNDADGSEIYFEFGSIVFSTNVKSLLDARIASNQIKGFGGLSTPTAVFANGVTTLTAPDPMNRAPVYTTVLAGSRNLTWTNLAPITPAEDVWVDVWFGTDPNKLGTNYTKVVSKGKNVASVTVSAPILTEPTKYYWQVDSYLKGDPAIVTYDATNPVTEGLVTSFDVTANTPPSVVINTPPTATWINEPIQLNSTLTDDGISAVTYLWTSDVPNAVFLPSNSAANPTVTVGNSGPFTVTVTVNDGFNPPASASVRHVCEVDPCQAAIAVIGLKANHPADIAADCKINLADFAELASAWLYDYSLTNPVPVP